MVDCYICARNKYPEEFDTEETERLGLSGPALLSKLAKT
jgi:hypothetical protein